MTTTCMSEADYEDGLLQGNSAIFSAAQATLIVKLGAILTDRSLSPVT